MYLYEELTDEAKENAITNVRELGSTITEGWWKSIYDDAKTYMKMLGFDVIQFSFSGFYGQGDGASIDVVFNSELVKTDELKEYAPEIYEKIKKTFGFFFEATRTPKDAWVEARTTAESYRPYVEYSFTSVEIDDPELDEDELSSQIEGLLEDGVDENNEKILKIKEEIVKAGKTKENIKEWLDKAHDELSSMLYQTLKVEYEWLTSDEVIIEQIVANQTQFTENGDTF